MRLLSSEKVANVTKIPQFKQSVLRNVVKEMQVFQRVPRIKLTVITETRFKVLCIKFLIGIDIYKYFIQRHKR